MSARANASNASAAPRANAAPASKWIQFRELEASGRKTRVFEVAVKTPTGDFGTQLGRVSWYAPWRRFSFYPWSGMVFESQCLRDVAAFCDWATGARKAERKAAAK